MNLADLPENIQNELKEKRLQLCQIWCLNSPYEVCFTNLEGTRYFHAIRKPYAYTDDKGNYMPFGGGSRWTLSYGKILWDRKKQVLGKEYDYFWTKSGQKFGKSANGTIIPAHVDTKAEVLQIAKNIGIFVMAKNEEKEENRPCTGWKR